MKKAFGIEYKHGDFLRSKTLQDVLANRAKRDLIMLNPEQSLQEALQILGNNNILSAPVYDSQSQQLIALVDVVHMVTFITQDLRNQEELLPKIKERRIRDLIENDSSTKDVLTFTYQDSLHSLIHRFSREYKRHRALVVDPQKKGLTLVSQTDIIRYLVDHESELGPILTSRLEDLNLANPSGADIYHLRENDPTFLGFQRMAEKSINAIAIIDHQGRIIGNLSASDLRGIQESKLIYLFRSSTDFLQVMGRKFKPVVGSSRISLGEAMTKALAARVHRIWIVDEKEKALGVVTFSDMLSPLVTEGA
jgi:CBS-domain-containing membrane protein